MFNLDAITNKNNKNDDKKWPYRKLIIGPSGSTKNNALLNLIQKQNDDSLIDKIYLYAKDLSEPKYQLLIERRENAGIKNYTGPSTFIEYSNTMGDVYNSIDDYNPKRKRKILIVFDDMIADIMTNKKFQAIIKDLFIRCRKLSISLLFIPQSYSGVPKEAKLNSTHYVIIKINNRRELQSIAVNQSDDIGYNDFLKIYRNCTKEPYSFFTIDATLPPDNSMRFRKNFSDSPL